jgi:hypothetical protein
MIASRMVCDTMFFLPLAHQTSHPCTARKKKHANPGGSGALIILQLLPLLSDGSLRNVKNVAIGGWVRAAHPELPAGRRWQPMVGTGEANGPPAARHTLTGAVGGAAT